MIDAAGRGQLYLDTLATRPVFPDRAAVERLEIALRIALPPEPAARWHGREAMRISISSWATTQGDLEISLRSILKAAGTQP